MAVAKRLLLVCIWLGVVGGLRAEDQGQPSAKKRAALFQAEVHAVLTKHQWHVATEAPGTLVLDHTLIAAGPDFNAPAGKSGYTRTTIIFKPKSLKETGCRAFMLNCEAGYYLSADVKKYKGRVPTPADPGAVKTVERLINEALDRLLHTHPEYLP